MLFADGFGDGSDEDSDEGQDKMKRLHGVRAFVPEEETKRKQEEAKRNEEADADQVVSEQVISEQVAQLQQSLAHADPTVVEMAQTVSAEIVPGMAVRQGARWTGFAQNILGTE